jgi:acyl-CoA reductase-like NAD-dependent aldehyde dehydrogenase
MKKNLVLWAFASLFAFSSVIAQGSGGQRMTPEERTKVAMEKMAVLNLEADAASKTTVIINDFYKAAQTAMEEMRASGSTDREAMMAKRKTLADERDSKLSTVLTVDQMKKWKEEIEPSLRPQRPAGQGQ